MRKIYEHSSLYGWIIISIDTDNTNKNDYSNSYTDTVEVEETFDNKEDNIKIEIPWWEVVVRVRVKPNKQLCNRTATRNRKVMFYISVIPMASMHMKIYHTMIHMQLDCC